MSGGSLHDGLEYQILITVLAAIDLAAVNGEVDALVIEPPSEEDLEGDVSRALADDEPAPMEGEADHRDAEGGYRLVIQSKRRDNGTWSAAAVSGLLGHGKRRLPAADRLNANGRTRYLLVTSGHLVGPGAAGLHVEAFGEWAPAAPDGSPFAAFNAASLCRVAVMDGLTEPLLHARIAERLRDALSMPFDRVEACVSELAAAVRRRSRSQSTGVWTRAEIEEVLAAHDALLPGRLEIDLFVEPLNYEAIRETLASTRAILITGPSGTGKTRVAHRLVEETRLALNGSRSLRLSRSDDAQRFAEEVRDGPVVLYLDDPWGPVTLGGGAPAWTKALGDEIANRHPDAWLIITSRSDVLQEARTNGVFTPWTVVLDADQYGSAEKTRLLGAGLKALPFQLQGRFEPYEWQAVNQLETPLEIRVLVTGLATPPRDGQSDADWAHAALAAARMRRYQDVVALQVAARGDDSAAVVLYLLLLTRDALTREDLVRVRRAMNGHGGAPRFEALADFLRAGQSLDHVDGRFSYAHPQVGAGLLTAARRDPATFETIGLRLLEALTAETTPAGPLWAARILAALQSEDPALAEEWRTLLSAPARAALDSCLVQALATLEGRPFSEAFSLAAALGSTGVFAFDFARWALARPPMPPEPDFDDMMPSWSAPPVDPAWPTVVAADPSAVALVERFVEDAMPYRNHFYPSDFPAHLAALGLDLTQAFGRTVLDHVGYGYFDAMDMMVEGALPNLRALDPAVQAAQRFYGADEVIARDGWRLQLANGVFDDDYSQHLAEPDDEHYSAGVLTRAFVKALRLREGWGALAAYPDVGVLAWDWIQAIDDDGEADIAEFEALLDLTRGDGRRAGVWNLIAGREAQDLAALTRDRALKESTPKAQAAACRALAVHDPDHLAAEQDRLKTLGLEPVLRLHRDLRWTVYDARPSRLDDAQKALTDRLAPPEAELVRVAIADLEALPVVTGPAVALARTILTQDAELAARLLSVTGAETPHVDVLYACAMDGWTPEQTEVPLAALSTVIATGRQDLVKQALLHPLGAVAGLAIAAADPVLTPSELAAVPGTEGYQVRRAILTALAGIPGDDAALALLDYCDPTYRSLHENARHAPLARFAAALLAKRAALSETVRQTMSTRILTLREPQVRRDLFRRLGAEGALERTWLRKLALTSKVERRRALAADALLFNAAAITPGFLEGVSADAVAVAPIEAAASLTRLIGLRGEATQVDRLLARLAGRADLAALAVLLVAPQAPDRNQRIADLFPADHPARGLADPASGQVGFNALDEVATPAVILQIRRLLPERFEPKPQPTWPMSHGLL